MVEWLFLAVLWGCLKFVIVVFPDHTHLLLFINRGMLKIRLRNKCASSTVYYMYSARTSCSNQENTTVCDVAKLAGIRDVLF